MANNTTLRYALNLISTASVVARRRLRNAPAPAAANSSANASNEVDIEDLRRVYGYFMDEARSLEFIKEQKGMLVDEIEGLEGELMGWDEGTMRGSGGRGRAGDGMRWDTGDKMDTE
jgi:RuvB-like protein 2